MVKKPIPTIIYIVFWLHFAIAFLAAVLTPFMAATTLYLLVSWNLGFLYTTCALGVLLHCFVYGVNHITSPMESGYCYLTDLEQKLRKKYDLPICGQYFTPRFFKKIEQIIDGDFRSIPK